MRRWMRTLPNYFLFIAINVVLSYSIRPAEIPNLLYYASFTQNFAWHHPSFFGEAWSLAVEEIFYLTTPLLISVFMLCGKSPKRSMLGTAALVIMACTAARILVIYSLNPPLDEGIRKIAALRLDSIMYGVVAAVVLSGIKISSAARKISAVAGVITLCAISYFMSKPDAILNSSYPIRILIFTLTSIGAILLIISSLKSRVPSFIAIVTSRISKWSYSAYLANLPVLFAITHIHPNRDGATAGILLFIAYIASTFAISAIIYKTFESKILRIRDERFSKEPTVVETQTDAHTVHVKTENIIFKK